MKGFMGMALKKSSGLSQQYFSYSEMRLQPYQLYKYGAMMDAPQTLKSRLYRLETVHDQDTWVEKCQGYPIFKKQDSIFKLKYYSLPNRQLYYEITVNSNIKFDKNQNGVQWIQIKEGQIMAISFKEEFSSNAFWKMIDEYQKKYQVTVPNAVGTHFYFQYRVPDPTIENLPQFLAELEKIPENERHQRLTSILLTKREFLPHLCTVLKKLEAAQVQDLSKLEMMYKVMKIIFNASNEQLLYELVMDDCYYSVLGALQYDPNFRNARPNHRDYIHNHSKMISVVPFKNNDLLNLCIVTQRIQYLRQCALLPYLNDYSFSFTSAVIRGNYKRIISQIFNPKKKEFINELFDHLRKQNALSYKLLRQIFRIGKTIAAEDFYLHLAERDYFDIMIRNMKDLKDIQQQQQLQAPQTQQSNSTTANKKKKKKPEQIAECADISIQILEQFMEYQPLHFKNYCVSETEIVSKYPAVTFLLDQYDSLNNIDHKMENILRILVTDKENHPIKAVTHEKVLTRFLNANTLESKKKWILLFNRIILPLSVLVDDKLDQLLTKILSGCWQGPKEHQINMLGGLKSLIDNYIQDDERINALLFPKIETFVKFFVNLKGSRGIRVSIFESIFKSKKLSRLVKALIQQLEKLKNPLLSIPLRILNNFLSRQEVVLPTNLKRDRSLQLQDDECFEKIEKKIKID